MKQDYTPFYSTVAVLVPVLLIALFVGQDSLLRANQARAPRPPAKHWWQRQAPPWANRLLVIVYVIAGLVSLTESIAALYEPAQATREDRAVIMYSLVVVLAAVFLELLIVARQVSAQEKDGAGGGGPPAPAAPD